MTSTNDFENLLGALRNSEPYFDDAGFSAGVCEADWGFIEFCKPATR